MDERFEFQLKYRMSPCGPILTLSLVLLVGCGKELKPTEPTQVVAKVEPQKKGVFMKNVEGSWHGKKTLWTKYPDNPQESDIELVVSSGLVEYQWSYEGKAQMGTFKIAKGDTGVRVEWVDSWHSKDVLVSTGSEGNGVTKVSGTYSMGDGPAWTWRTEFYANDPAHFSIKMFNVLPDGLYPEMKERELPAVVIELTRVP